MIDKNLLDLKSDHRFVQFQLWRDCDCGCDFCYNKGLGNSDKVKSLNFIIDKIKNDPIVSLYNEVGFIGGETFGKELSEDIKPLFFTLMKLVIEKLKSNQFKKVYLTTALLFKDLSGLFQTIDLFKENNLIDKILICTSYDTKYRFKNENSKKLWENNMYRLHEAYPQLLIHTQTILTGNFINQVLSGNFNIVEFENKYQTSLDFIEPSCNTKDENIDDFNKKMPEFFPKRKDFIKFLHYIVENNQTDINRLLNPDLHSDLLFVEFDDQPYEIVGRRKNGDNTLVKYCEKLGRKIMFSRYFDVDKRLDQDVIMFRELNQ